MLLESKVSPPAKYFTQFAWENSSGGGGGGVGRGRKDASEKLQISQLKSILQMIFQMKMLNKSK